jgi:hypothetical protein
MSAFTEANTVEHMILDTPAMLGGTQAPVSHWNMRPAEFAL